jgi:hypothetical protein
MKLRQISIGMTILVMITACQSSPPPVAVVPTSPVVFHTPAPSFSTYVPPPTFTLTPSPTPTVTPTALPSVEVILAGYQTTVRPILDRLYSAPKAPSGYILPPASDWRIQFLPLDERGYFVQHLLFQDKFFGNPEGSTNLYVTYSYRREGCLGLWGMSCDVQGFSVRSLMFVEGAGTTYFLQELPAWGGGAGSTSHWEMVERTISPFPILGENGGNIEKILELLVGFISGLDPAQRVVKAFDYPDLQTRLAILRQAIQSISWSDRMFATDSLKAIGPDAAVMVPELTKALHDEEYHVTWGAVDALTAIGPAASEAIPDLIVVAQASGEPPQCSAVSALGKIGAADEVVPALLPILEVKKKCLLQVFMDLRKYGEGSALAVPALIAIVEDKTLQEDDRSQAISTLGVITGKSCQENIECWQSWWDEHKK